MSTNAYYSRELLLPYRGLSSALGSVQESMSTFEYPRTGISCCELTFQK